MIETRKMSVFARRLAIALLSVALLLPALAIVAQDSGGRPPSFDLALADLSRRVNRTLTIADVSTPTTRWEWRGVTYSDSSLDCPQASEAITPGQVIGYQFIFLYRGITYDYRIALAQDETLRLCTTPRAGTEPTVQPIPTTTILNEPPAEFLLALADVGSRLQFTNAISLDDFEARTSRWSWKWRDYANSQLECPAEGVTVDNIPTGGWQFIFVYEGQTFDYRSAFNVADSLIFCGN
jgi:hypothetical protein